MPPIRLNPNDDYLTARAANPRTGLITPFTPAATSPNHSPSPFDYITIRSPPNTSVYNNRKNILLPRSPDLEFDLGSRRANGRQHQRGLSGPKWLDKIRKQSGGGARVGDEGSDALCGKGVRMGQSGGNVTRIGPDDMDVREMSDSTRDARARSASTGLQGQQMGDIVMPYYRRKIPAPYPATENSPDDLSFFNVPQRTRPPAEPSGASLSVSQPPPKNRERIRFDTAIQHPPTRQIPLQTATYRSPTTTYPKPSAPVFASTSTNNLKPPSSPNPDHTPSKRRSVSLPVLTTTLHFGPPATHEDRSPTATLAPGIPDLAAPQTRLPRIRRKPVVSPSDPFHHVKPILSPSGPAPHVGATTCLRSGEKARATLRPQPRPVQRRVRLDDSPSTLRVTLPGGSDTVDATTSATPDEDKDDEANENGNNHNDSHPSKETTDPPERKRNWTSPSPLRHLPSIRLVPPHLAGLPRHRHKAAAPVTTPATHPDDDPSLKPPGITAPIPAPPAAAPALTIKSLPALLAGLLCISHIPSIWNASAPAQSRLQGLRELLTFVARSLAAVLVGCCAFRVLGVVWSVVRVVILVVRFVAWVGRGLLA